MLKSTGDLRFVRLLLALPLVVLAAAGCGGKEAASPEPVVAASATSAGPAASSAAPAAAAPGVYKIDKKPCASLDLTAVQDLAGKPKEMRPDKPYESAISQMSHCNVTFKEYLLQGEINYFKTDSAKVMYDGLRGAVEKDTATTDVPGLGEGAYTYLDAATGPHVVAYDGNLYLSLQMGVLQFGRPKPGAEVFDPMIGVLKGTMAKLRG